MLVKLFMKMIIKSVLLIHKIRYKHGVKARQTSDNFLLPSSPRDKSTLTAKITDCFCLSKPQAWHIITARSVVHIIKGGKPPLYLITRQRAFSCGLMISSPTG